MELGQLLQFLDDWLATDRGALNESLTRSSAATPTASNRCATTSPGPLDFADRPAGPAARVRPGCGDSVGILLRAGAACVIGYSLFLPYTQVRGLTRSGPCGGGQGQDRTVDLPLFRRRVTNHHIHHKEARRAAPCRDSSVFRRLLRLDLNATMHVGARHEVSFCPCYSGVDLRQGPGLCWFCVACDRPGGRTCVMRSVPRRRTLARNTASGASEDWLDCATRVMCRFRRVCSDASGRV
jgi:hypothetical protein